MRRVITKSNNRRWFTRTFQYRANASFNLPRSIALPCRISLMWLVPVVLSSKLSNAISGRYKTLIWISSTRAADIIWDCSLWVGPPNIIIARVSFIRNSSRWIIWATCRVIYTWNKRLVAFPFIKNNTHIYFSLLPLMPLVMKRRMGVFRRESLNRCFSPWSAVTRFPTRTNGTGITSEDPR